MASLDDAYLDSDDVQSERDDRKAAGKSELSHLDFAAANLRFTLDLIRLADQKAQNLLRITLALFAAAFVGVPPVVLALRKFAEQGGWRLGLFLGTVVLYVACSACLMAAMICILRVIRPRREQGGQRKCVLFFSSVAEMSLDDFLRMLREMDYDSALAEVGAQLHQNARVARSKYVAVDTSIRWLVRGVLIGAVFALVLLVFTTLLSGNSAGQGV